MIFSNECSISLQSHSHRCFRMADKPTKRKPKPKHPLKVHVWGGISRRGATRFCIFDGIMDADLYAMFLRRRSFHLLEINFPSTSSCRTVTRRIRPCECKLSSGDQFTQSKTKREKRRGKRTQAMCRLSEWNANRLMK